MLNMTGVLIQRRRVNTEIDTDRRKWCEWWGWGGDVGGDVEETTVYMPRRKSWNGPIPPLQCQASGLQTEKE